MSLQDPLCKLPPGTPAGCCGAAPKPPAAPIRPSNAAGLSSIAYRIGTFTTFRQAMLDRIADPALFPGGENPFKNWQPGASGDYQTMFVELWAYLADILTFYQERVANEAYLPTAAERDSMMRLAALVNYRPSPGSGASGLAAFTVEKGKSVTVPAGFRVASKAQPPLNGLPALPAAVFESMAALLAHAESNEIPLSPVAPTNQFAKLSSIGIFFGPLSINPPLLATTAVDLYGAAGPLYAATFAHQAAFSEVAVLERAFSSQASREAPPPGADAAFKIPETRSTVLDLKISGGLLDAFRGRIFPGRIDPGIILPPRPPYKPFVNSTTRTLVLKGVNTRLAVGDYLLAVENEGDSTLEKTSAHQITSVTADKAAGRTTITWTEPVDSLYDRSKSEVAVYALRVTAGLFGNTAPAFNTLPATLTGRVNNTDGPFINQNWDNPATVHFFIPKAGDPTNFIFLDAVYDDATGTQAKPGWAVLMADGEEQIFHVLDGRQVSKTGYALTSKVTRLTVRETVKASTFPLRTTVVLAASQRLDLENNLPLPPQVSGSTLILTGLHPQLQSGQTVVLRGPLLESPADAPILNAEVRSLAAAPIVDAANQITSVTLSKPLDQLYTRSGSVLLGNVVEITQGETVKDEVLGSGNGLELQSFVLKKQPLTYLPSTDPEGIVAVDSTLLVTVNGTRWAERPTLVDVPADSQSYTATQDAAGVTAVQFGDGFNGARPPSGRDNVRARYRKGLGVSGNVGVGGVQQLTDNLAGLQKVTNPQATSGGADAESPSGIRGNAPTSVRSFGRAVSAADYAALALTFPGVAKASGSWIRRDASLRAVPQPYVQLTIATSNQLPLSQQTPFAGKLRSFLDARRDPNVTMRIVDFTPVFVDLTVTVDIDNRFPRLATLALAQAALSPTANPDGRFGYFAFERRGFGESVHLSAVHAALLAVPGVVNAHVTRFRIVGSPAAAPVADSIFVRPAEIVFIGNSPSTGTLSVLAGEGGFADQ